jgi:hypothetical protein
MLKSDKDEGSRVMPDTSRRKELREQYKQTLPEAGVYRIVNRETNKSLISSTMNLSSIQNKLAFAQSTKTASVLDQRLATDLQHYGFAAFSLEILERYDPTPEQSRAEIQSDLATLVALWREKFDTGLLY